MNKLYLLIPAFIGVMVFLAGILFKLMHWVGWPLMMLGGGALVVLSIFLLLLLTVLENKKQ